jgi:type II secretory pathway component GspD/PulD (secretin)
MLIKSSKNSEYYQDPKADKGEGLDLMKNKINISKFRFGITLLILIALFVTGIRTNSLFAQSLQSPQVSQKIDLVLKNASLRFALESICLQAGLNLKSHADLTKKVNVEIRDLPLKRAISRILEAQSLQWTLDGSNLHVFLPFDSSTSNANTIQTGASVSTNNEPKVSKMIYLKSRNAEDVARTLKELAEGVKIVPDIPTNGILMTGKKADIRQATKLAKTIDTSPVVRSEEEIHEFVSEVFSLEYIADFTDLEENLNFILYGSKSAQTTTQTTSAEENKVFEVKKEYYLFDKARRILMITATRDKMAIIKEYFSRINTPLPQVLIEAHIVALDAGFERQLGINWNFAGGYQGPIRPTDKPLGVPQSTVGNNTSVDPASGFQFGRWNLSALTAVLQSAQTKNKGKILSQPRLMTLTGHEARIDISTRYPYKQSTTVNETGTTENVTFVPVGITLTVKPQVNEKAGTIVMNVSPVVSDLLGFRNDVPITTSREAQTLVEVRDGETIVIGGLLRNEELRERNGVPVLKDIPLIGDFFKWSRKTNSKTNLFIMITPRLVDVNKELKIDSAPKSAEAVIKEKIQSVERSENILKTVVKQVKSAKDTRSKISVFGKTLENSETEKKSVSEKTYKDRLKEIKRRYLGKS